MEWLENIAGGFTIFILASLLFLVIGFLADSTEIDLADEQAPLSRRKHAGLALFFFAMAGVWAYSLLSKWRQPEGELFLLFASAVWILIALIWAIQHTKAAISR